MSKLQQYSKDISTFDVIHKYFERSLFLNIMSFLFDNFDFYLNKSMRFSHEFT